MKTEIESSSGTKMVPCSGPSNSFIGSMVSVDCGPLGIYQGRVLKIDPVMNVLTITHAFINGLKCDEPELNLSSTTIQDIKIIHASQEASEIISRKATPSKMTKEIDDVTKPTCTSPVKIIKATSKARTGFLTSNSSGPSEKGADEVASASVYVKTSCRRKLSPPDSPSQQVEGGVTHHRQRMNSNAARDLLSSDNKQNQGNDNGVYRQDSPTKYRSSPSEAIMDYLKQHQQPSKPVPKRTGGNRKQDINSKNNECFSAPTESILQDFDFESNLALFNKKAVFQEIENGFPELSLNKGGHTKTPTKYRHDENVLQPGASNTTPVKKQQIRVPDSKGKPYVTDCGLLVPSIPLEMRERLCDVAHQYGLSHSRQLEAYGHAAAEMAIHLIGGSHRIHPKNDHQMPMVVVLTGSHNHGALGACCARILASHSVQVTLLNPPGNVTTSMLSQEIELCKLSGVNVVHSVTALPETIDLVVSALDSPGPQVVTRDHLAWIQSVVCWYKNKDIKAQILALDPPSNGPSISARWSLCRVLPLNQMGLNCGRLYLCDLSLPAAIFTKVGITYVSPFGSKSVISLHDQD